MFPAPYQLTLVPWWGIASGEFLQVLRPGTTVMEVEGLLHPLACLSLSYPHPSSLSGTADASSGFSCVYDMILVPSVSLSFLLASCQTLVLRA